jgi:hypothetical protein
VGVCVGDDNNDGYEDLFLTYFGHNRLYRNNGNGTFTDVTNTKGYCKRQAEVEEAPSARLFPPAGAYLLGRTLRV